MRTAATLTLLFLFSNVSTKGNDLTWTPLPDLPSELGVAGPYNGVVENTLIVAGGANFPLPVWKSDKVWHDTVYALTLNDSKPAWEKVGKLLRPLGYGTTISVKDGIVCIGGNDAEKVYADSFLLTLEKGKSKISPLPSFPTPIVYATSAMMGEHIYVTGGQTGPELETATKAVYRIDWSKRDNPAEFQWEKTKPYPGPARAFSSFVKVKEGETSALYLIGGRRVDQSGEIEFRKDVCRLGSDQRWSRVADLPKPNAAGTAAFVDGKIYVVAGADGSLFKKSDKLKDNHPGFPKTILSYDPTKDEWSDAGEMSANQVTTESVPWKNGFLLPSGEVRPRVRTKNVWLVSPVR